MLVRFRVLCVRCQVFSPDTWPLTLDTSNSAGDWRDRATPVPIPNTVVKPVSADGTAIARSWESRPLPAFPPLNTKPARVSPSGLRTFRRRALRVRATHRLDRARALDLAARDRPAGHRQQEHTSELQSRQ